MPATLERTEQTPVPEAFTTAFKKDRPDILNPNDQWWLLPGTGFNVRGEIERLRRDYLNGQAQGLSKEESLRRTVDEIRGNVGGYKREYIDQEVLLVSPLAVEEVKGKKRLVNGISRLPLLEAITEKERYGAVREAFVEVEQFLINAQEGEMAVMYSPGGWSGFQDNVGQDINYHNEQLYMWRKGARGKIESFTLVADLNLDQGHRLLRALGVTAPLVVAGDHRQTLANTVRNVAFLEQGSFEQVINLTEEAKGDKVARVIKDQDGKVEATRTFAEARRKLKNKDELLRVDQDCDQLINEFIQLVVENTDKLEDQKFIKYLEVKLGLTIIEMSSLIRGREENPQLSQPTRGYRLHTVGSISEIKDQLAYLQSRPGCAGGGISGSLGSSRTVFNTGMSAVLSGGGGLGSKESSKMCEGCGETLCLDYCVTCTSKN